MTNELTDIQSQLNAFLSTEPNSEAVNSLIERLKEYEWQQQSKRVKADLAWKEQLPAEFPPGNKKLREKFRRMFNQLNKQGIAVTYNATVTYTPDSPDVNMFRWMLVKGSKMGGLMWHKSGNKWEILNFKFEDEKGNPLNEFSDVSTHN